MLEGGASRIGEKYIAAARWCFQGADDEAQDSMGAQYAALDFYDYVVVPSGRLRILYDEDEVFRLVIDS